MKQLFTLCFAWLCLSSAIAQSITTAAISGNYCGGTSLTVSYTRTGSFNASNQFRVQLSAPNGSFNASAQIIGSVASTASGSITATIPSNITWSNQYRLRVISTSPAVNGTNNGSNLTLTPAVTPAISIAASVSGTICPGTSVTFTATPTNGGSAPSYQWRINGNNAGTNSPTFTLTSLANNDVVTCRMTSNAVCALPAVVTSNSITMSISDTQAPVVNVPANITALVTSGCSAVVNYQTPTITDNCNTCSTPPTLSGYTNIGMNNGVAFYVSNTAQTWSAANSAASAVGAKLATVRSAAQNTWMVNAAAAAGVTTYWIGFNDEIMEGTYVWASGEPVNYTNWNSGEPNNSGNEDYVQVLSNGLWNDLGTAQSMRSVIELSCIAPTRTAGIASGGTFPLGVSTVTFSATDASGNVGTASFTVTVVDNVAPTVNCTSTTPSVNMSNNCTATMPDYRSLATAIDNCSATSQVTFSQSPAPGSTITGSGLQLVTITATDAAGNQGTCTFNINKIDVTPPTITCPANITVNAAQGICGAFVNYTINAADGCLNGGCAQGTLAGYTLIGSWNNHTYYRSNNSMLWPAANTAAQALGGHLLTIESATENNLFTGLGQHWLGLSDQASEGNFTWVTGEPVVYTSWNTGEPNNAGTNGEQYAVINWSAGLWNDFGNSTSGTLPFIVEFDCVNLNLVNGMLSGSLFPIGTTTVTYSASDITGNTSAPCSFTVTVVDNAPPTITVPTTVTVSAALNACSAVVNYPTPVVTDNCGNCTTAPVIAGYTALGVYNSRAYYISTGTYNIVNARAHAVANGGTLVSISSSAENTFIRNAATVAGIGNYWIGFSDETTEGTFAWDNGQTILYTNWAAGEPNDFNLNEDFTQVYANGFWNDLNGISVIPYVMSRSCLTPVRTAGPASGSTFPVGTTPVTFSYTDVSGNTASGTFNVVVNDVTPPTITCPGTQTLNVGVTCTGTLPDYRSLASRNDLCTAANTITITQSPAPGTVLSGAGNTTVTLTATDTYNNAASCTFTVVRSTTPSVTIAAVGGTAICPNSTVTFVATPTNGGTNPSFQWRLNGANVGTNSSSYTVSNLATGNTISCIMTSSATCATPATATSNTLTITVLPTVAPSISINANPGSTLCSGSLAVFTSSITHGGSSPAYQWRVNGNPAGTSSATFVSAALNNGDVVTCTLTSSAACPSPSVVTSNGITMNVIANVTPSLSIISGTNSICSGSSVNFTATPVNGGSSPTYQWRVNNVPAGANSATFSSNTLANGAVVTCRLTSNAACLTSNNILSNTVVMSVTPSVTPLVTISATNNGNACSGSEVVLNANCMNAGANPTFVWKRNGNTFGANAPVVTSAALHNGDAVVCEMTSSAACATSASVSSNVLSIALQGGSTFYADNDGDGFGNLNASVVACTMPLGYTNMAGDCDDDNIDVNPGTDEWENDIDDNCNGLIDEGLILQQWFMDADGDGFGNPDVSIQSEFFTFGYVLNNTDCNDTNALVNTNASEVCSDGIDNNCNEQVDENCGPDNDLRANARMLLVSSVGSCAAVNGSLFGATTGAEAQSTAPAGHDVWYYFTAPSNGVSIRVVSPFEDVLLELQNENGGLIKTENAVATAGSEILNIGNLIPGNLYRLAVRSYSNVPTAESSFTLCAESLPGTRLTSDYNAGVSFCQLISCNTTAAEQYIFCFRKTATGEVIESPQNNPSVLLSNVSGLNFNGTYQAYVDVIYLRQRGNGSTETVRVMASEATTISINQHTVMNLRNSDTCPNTKAMNAVIGSNSSICGAVGYQWQFIRTVPSSSNITSVQTGANGNLINLSAVPGLQPGMQYAVRVRPIFSDGVFGNFGSWVCMQTAAQAAAMQMQSNGPFDADTQQMEMRIYPNPANDAAQFHINTDLNENATLEIYSVTGALVYSENVAGPAGTYNMPSAAQWPSGVYVVRLHNGNAWAQQRWLIQR